MPDDQIEAEYPYRTSWTVIVLTAAASGALAPFMAYTAMTNRKAWHVRGIALDAGQATALFWFVAAFFAVVFAWMPFLAAARLRNPQRVAFTRAGIILPRSRRTGEEPLIPYAQVSVLSVDEVPGEKILKVDHPGGRSILLASKLGRRAFEEVRSRLAERVACART